MFTLSTTFLKGKQTMTDKMIKDEYTNDLQSLLQFINFDLMSMEPHEIVGVAHLYSSFMADKDFDSNFLDFSEHYFKCIKGLIQNPTPQILKERLQFFSEIRMYAEDIVQSIVKGVDNEQEFEIQCNAPMRAHLKVINGKIESFYSLAAIAPEHGLSLQHEKDKMDVMLLNIINSLGSDLMKIKQCKKNDCNAFFWQPTKRPKNYCSQRCAGAVRQRKFIKVKQCK